MGMTPHEQVSAAVVFRAIVMERIALGLATLLTFAALCLVVGALLVWRTRRFDAREDEHAKQLDAIRADHAKQVDEMRAAMERTNERVIGAFMELVKHDSDGEKT